MGIAEEIALFEDKLNELVRRYEQYFLGLEKREPVRLLEDVERIARRYSATPISNTMVKFRYNSLVARLGTYKQHWNRILRLMEEGKYSRDRFRMEMHQLNGKLPTTPGERPLAPQEIDGVYRQYIEARKACNMRTDNITHDVIQSALEKQKPTLQKKYSCDKIEFRVVVEDGKPKIKARPKS